MHHERQRHSHQRTIFGVCLSNLGQGDQSEYHFGDCELRHRERTGHCCCCAGRYFALAERCLGWSWRHIGWEKNLLLISYFSIEHPVVRFSPPIFIALALGVAPPSLSGALFAAPDPGAGEERRKRGDCVSPVCTLEFLEVACEPRCDA